MSLALLSPSLFILLPSWAKPQVKLNGAELSFIVPLPTPPLLRHPHRLTPLPPKKYLSLKSKLYMLYSSLLWGSGMKDDLTVTQHISLMTSLEENFTGIKLRNNTRVGHCLLLDTNKIPIPILTIQILSFLFFIYLICKLIMSLRWLLPKK